MTLHKWWRRLGAGRSWRAGAARGPARPCLEVLEARCLPASRSVVSVLVNNTGSALIRESASLDHGEWTNGVVPPARIEVGQKVTWESESNGFLTGTEGRATYRLEGTLSATPWTFVLHWDDPF